MKRINTTLAALLATVAFSVTANAAIQVKKVEEKKPVTKTTTTTTKVTTKKIVDKAEKADKKVAVKSTDKKVTEDKADKKVVVKSTDKKVTEDKADKKVTVKKTDKKVADKKDVAKKVTEKKAVKKATKATATDKKVSHANHEVNMDIPADLNVNESRAVNGQTVSANAPAVEVTPTQAVDASPAIVDTVDGTDTSDADAQ